MTVIIQNTTSIVSDVVQTIEESKIGGVNGVISPDSAITYSATQPVTAAIGQRWWDSNTAKLFMYYTDTDGSQWVEVSNIGPIGLTGTAGTNGTNGTNGTTIAVQSTAPSTPSVGTLWVDTTGL